MSPERKSTKVCAPSWCWREQHGQPVYSVAFNQADTTQSDIFAAVSANWVTIYQLPSAEGALVSDEAQTDTGVGNRGRKRKSGSSSSTLPKLEPLQSYADEDPDESFYCVAWGVNEHNGNAWLAAAGKQRHIRLIDCHRGAALRTMQGHGGAVHEVPCCRQHARPPPTLPPTLFEIQRRYVDALTCQGGGISESLHGPQRG